MKKLPWLKIIGSALVLTVLVVIIIIGVVNHNKKYTITFDPKGGSAVESIVTRGLEDLDVKESTLDGYDFLGWYFNESGGAQLTNSYYKNIKLARDVTVYARWELVKFNIVFNTNGGDALENIKSSGNGEIQLPTPSKDGYVFDGWFLDDETFLEPFTGNEYTSQTLLDNINLYAKWTDDLKVMSVEIQGGSIKNYYYYNDEINLTGARLILKHANGTTSYASITTSMISMFTTRSGAGEFDLTLQYTDGEQTFIKTYKYTVVDAEEIQIVSGFKTSYSEGENLDLVGGILKVIMTDGMIKEIEITADMVSDFNTDAAGNYQMTIEYNDQTVVIPYTVS